MARHERIALIEQIQQARQSRVIAYICSNRNGAQAQIGEDAVRIMYDHVRRIGKVRKLDLYLYSLGGAVEVPWLIVTMLREYCDELSVLVPYRAMSAATLIALGCDEIVMGRKAELGPIDPALSRVTQEGGTAVQETIRVEDVMSYISFLKDKAGLGDQTAISENVRILSEKLTPQILGSIYRTQTHIRMVARKLLTSHVTRMDDQRINLIVDSLAEKTYLHGHGIGRREAEELNLPIARPDDTIEEVIWSLLMQYESAMEMLSPVDPETMLGDDDEVESPVVMAMIESAELNSAFRGTLKFRRVRQAPGAVNININLGVNLPPGLNPPEQMQQALQQILQQVQNSVPQMVMEQVRKQSPVLKIEGRVVHGRWDDVTNEPI